MDENQVGVDGRGSACLMCLVMLSSEASITQRGVQMPPGFLPCQRGASFLSSQGRLIA